MQKLEVANTILNQLGGSARLGMLIGAKHFIGGENYVSFKHMPAASKTNHIRITLTPLDLYKVEFIQATMKSGIKVKQVHDNVFVGDLRELIEKTTGLYLSL